MKKLSLICALFLSAQLHAQFQKLVPVLLQDINPGAGNGAMPFQARYFFAGQETDDNYEPWLAGPLGCTKQADINPNGSSMPGFTAYDCGATSTATGRELWLGSGIIDLLPGIQGSDPREFIDGANIGCYVVAESQNFSVNHRELYRANNVSQPFVPLTTLWSEGDMYPMLLKSKLYFSADSATTGSAANELWLTNGSPGGTHLLKDINPGGINGSFPKYMTALDTSRFVFTADDGANGRELYISNGTEAGTMLLKDINPGAGSSDAYGFKFVGTKMLFFADDGIHGMEPWETDGTNAGTRMIMDVYPGADSSIRQGHWVADWVDAAYFAADDGVHGRELWVYYAYNIAPNILMDINPGAAAGIADFNEMNCIVGEGLLFAADDGVHGREPWTYNWMPGMPVMIADINPGAGNSMSEGINGFSMQDTVVYFVANDGVHGYEVWAMRAVTGVDDIRMSAADIKIYPNPTTGMVTIQTNAKALQAEVCNAMGQLLVNIQVNNSTINLQNYPDGVYYIKLKEKDRVVHTGKLVLAR